MLGRPESPAPLQSPASTRVLETARHRATAALLGVSTALLQLPPRVAASWFTAPPARFRPPWGSPREATPHAFARGCAGRALGPPSGVSDPVSPLPARRPEDDSPGVCAPTARSDAEDPVHPGIPAPGTFRPQGLITLPADSSPPRLATARRPPQRPWGSPFRVLLLTASGTSLEASPLLSFFQSARRRVVATPEVGSGGKGARLAAARRRRRPNLALLGLCPSKAFSSDHLRTGFPILFPLVLLLGMLPTDHAQPGLQGMFSGGSGLVSQETAGLPGVWHLIERGASMGNVRSGLMASPRPPYASIGRPLRSTGLPDRSSAPRRVGATTRT